MASIEATIKVLEDNMISFSAVTDKYVPTEVIPMLQKWAVNQPVIYRHEHPAKGWGGEILGRVIESEVKNTEENLTVLTGKAVMFKNSDYQKFAWDYIVEMEKEQTPVRISVGYQEFNKDGKVIDAQIYEFSITHIPVCKDCVVTVGDYNLEEEEEKKKSEELREKLDKMSGKVKQLEEEKSSLETKIKEYEKKYIEEKDKSASLESRLKALEEEVKYAKIEPKVKQLVKLYEDPDLESYFKSIALKEGGAEIIEKKLEERLKVKPQIETEPIRELEQKNIPPEGYKPVGDETIDKVLGSLYK